MKRFCMRSAAVTAAALFALSAAVWADQDALTPYQELGYAAIGDFDAAQGGTMTRLIPDMAGHAELQYPAAGHSFETAADALYLVTVKFTALSNEPVSTFPGIFILRENLTGDFSYEEDIINGYEFQSAAPNTAWTVTLNVYGDGDKMNILMLDRSGKELGYSLVVRSMGTVVMYSDLIYTPIANIGEPVTGELSKSAKVYEWDKAGTAAGHSFTAKTGTWYNVTAEFSSDHDTYANIDLIAMTSELSGGYNDDVIMRKNEYGTKDTWKTMLSLKGKGGVIHILMRDDKMNKLGYTLTVEETDPPNSYAELDYTDITIENGVGSFSGTLTKSVEDISGLNVFAAGHKFATEKDKTYRIIATFNSANRVYATTHAVAIREPSGNWNSDYIDGEWWWGENTQWKLYYFDVDGTGGDMYVVMYDSQALSRQLNYTLTVADIAVALHRITITGGKVIAIDSVDNGSTKVVKGEPVTIIAEEKDGYAFSNWTVTGVQHLSPAAAAEPVLQFAMPDNEVAVVANYTKTTGITSIQTSDRTVPGGGVDRDAVIAPIVITAAMEFKAGPNPVKKSDGKVSIFAEGKQLQNGTLTVYDAVGNKVGKISVFDPGIINKNVNEKRVIGEWDLRDSKGREVAEGTYLIKGTVRTRDGKRERVAVMVSVR